MFHCQKLDFDFWKGIDSSVQTVTTNTQIMQTDQMSGRPGLYMYHGTA